MKKRYTCLREDLFQDIDLGICSFLMLPDCGDISKGDIIEINEIELFYPAGERETGNRIIKRISYVLDCEAVNLDGGWKVLGLENCESIMNLFKS